MSELNVSIIRNEAGTGGPTIVGNTTITGTVDISGTLKPTGSLELEGDGVMRGNLSVTGVSTLGVITGATYYGDGSNLTNLPSSAGLGTALSDDETSPLSVMYYTDSELSIGATLTVDAPDSAKVAYTQYPQIVLQNGADLIVAAGDDFIPDILGIGTTGVGGGALTGDGGSVRADNIRNRAGTGAPTASHGLIVSGVTTATTFDGNLSGNITGSTIVGEHLDVTGVTTSSNLIVENSIYTTISTTSTDKTLVNRELCTLIGIGTTAGLTVTMPVSPQSGWEVGVAIAGTFLDSVVARNGSNIMAEAENMTVDKAYATLRFVYTDTTNGWRIF